MGKCDCVVGPGFGDRVCPLRPARATRNSTGRGEEAAGAVASVTVPRTQPRHRERAVSHFSIFGKLKRIQCHLPRPVVDTYCVLGAVPRRTMAAVTAAPSRLS